MNRPVASSCRFSPVTVSTRVSPVSLSSPWIVSTAEFQAKSIFGSANARSCMILEARSSSRRWISVTLEPKRDRKVASSTAESPPPTTAMCCSRKKKPSQVAHQETPWPGEPVLALDAELAVARAGRQDHGAGPVLDAGAVGDDLDVAGQVDLGDVVGDQLGAEPLGLRAHLVHQGRAHDAVAEAGEVLDLGGVHQRAAGGDRALEHQGCEVGAGGVHGGGVAGRAGADDDHVAGFGRTSWSDSLPRADGPRWLRSCAVNRS